MRNIMWVLRKLDRSGLKSRALQIMFQKALDVSEDEQEGDSELGRYVEYVVLHGHEKDSAYKPLIQWGLNTFGHCPECGGMLSFEDNAYTEGWVSDDAFCSTGCSGKYTDMVIADLIDFEARKYHNRHPEWSLTPELRAETIGAVDAESWRINSEGDAEQFILEFWNDWTPPTPPEPHQGEPWVV